MKTWVPGNPNGPLKSRWHKLSQSAFIGLLNWLSARERKALSGPQRAHWRNRRLAAVAFYRKTYGETDILKKFSGRHSVPRYPFWFPLHTPRKSHHA